MTLVSILVPVYNAAAFIEETVLSVLAQSHGEWELLLIDDGSTDATEALLGSLSQVDPRIRIFRQANAGTQAARNLGLEHARGEWIALLDHDDIWLPQKLERQLEVAREHPGVDLLFCNFARWDGKRELDAESSWKSSLGVACLVHSRC
jgi:glycosyltransferase involved in cell wall biosynthesis